MPKKSQKKVIPIKPAFKEPCNYCGYCCETAVCPTAIAVFPDMNRDDVPCALLDKDKKCMIFTREALGEFSAQMQDEIVSHHYGVVSLGVGCHVPDDARFFEQMDEFMEIRSKEDFACFYMGRALGDMLTVARDKTMNEEEKATKIAQLKEHHQERLPELMRAHSEANEAWKRYMQK